LLRRSLHRGVIGGGEVPGDADIDQPDPLRHRPVEAGDLRGGVGAAVTDILKDLDGVELHVRCDADDARTIVLRGDRPGNVGTVSIARGNIVGPVGAATEEPGGIVPTGIVEIGVGRVAPGIEHADLDAIALVAGCPDQWRGHLRHAPWCRVGTGLRLVGRPTIRLDRNIGENPDPVRLHGRHVRIGEDGSQLGRLDVRDNH